MAIIFQGAELEFRALYTTFDTARESSQNMDGNEDNTPTKSYQRVEVSPKSKDRICLQCGEYISNADVRRKLYSVNQRTKACLDLELLLGTKLDESFIQTNIVCRKCTDRNQTLSKKVFILRANFESAKKKILGQGTSLNSSKRLSKQCERNETDNSFTVSEVDSSRTASTKRRALFTPSE